jgi:hypothetical protein
MNGEEKTMTNMKTQMTMSVDEYVDAVASAYIDGFETAKAMLDGMDSDDIRVSIRKAIKEGLEKKEELKLAEVKSED